MLHNADRSFAENLPPDPLLLLQVREGLTYVCVCFNQDQLQQKIVCPGIVTCLSASPDGLYVLAGIGDAIYLWEVRDHATQDIMDHNSGQTNINTDQRIK